MLKIGVLGAGHLGKIHLKLLKESSKVDLVGFYDPDPEKSQWAKNEFDIISFNSLDDLIDNVDIVDVVTPTLSHFDCAVSALRKSKHVFIEKPVTSSIEEAKQLKSLLRESRMKMQVGHVERFNPAYLAAKPYINNPLFIETHRLSRFQPRGTDVSVVLDLMIHDIDIVLSLVSSNIKNISANGVSVISSSPDIANARLEFDNGCVANLTASRVSLNNMRKSRYFQKDAYISVDFLDKKFEIIRICDSISEPCNGSIKLDLCDGSIPKEIKIESPKIELINSIKMELETFVECIVCNSKPIVTFEDAYDALVVAKQIIEKIDINTSVFH